MRRFPKLLMLLACLMLSVTAVQAKVYLVTVGVADYPGSDNDLNYPVTNARSIANAYQAQDPNLVYVRLYNSEATVENILSTVRRVFSQASKNDIVVLFFSGHGSEGGFYAYDGSLSYNDLRKAMAKSKSRYKMIFADTCHAGTLRSKKGKSRKGDAASARRANVMLFLSSRDDEYSWEGGSIGQGFFSAFLKRALSGEADVNGDNVVTAKELYDFVHNGVVDFSSGRQHPVMWGKFPKNMPVIRLNN